MLMSADRNETGAVLDFALFQRMAQDALALCAESKRLVEASAAARSMGHDAAQHTSHSPYHYNGSDRADG